MFQAGSDCRCAGAAGTGRQVSQCCGLFLCLGRRFFRKMVPLPWGWAGLALGSVRMSRAVLGGGWAGLQGEVPAGSVFLSLREWPWRSLDELQPLQVLGEW